MRVLIIGAGGREHALAWKLSRSPLLTQLYVAPGNPGTAQCAENVAVSATDIDALVGFCVAHAIDLVVPGGEAALVLGIADRLAAHGIRCAGPTRAAARLEGSKSFTKEIADAAAIPTARWERFDDAEAAHEFVRRKGVPIVIKADGLAAGKGVVVAHSVPHAQAAIAEMMEAGSLGEAGSALVIEEYLEGEELSVFALCDGVCAVPLGAAQDHKREGEGDTGRNTGGMGAISPPPAATPAMLERVMTTIIRPTLAAMHDRGTPFRGILYAGLMLTAAGPKLIEYNVRFGDPECQALLPRLRSDLLVALLACCDGALADFDLAWNEDCAAAVVMAAKGYPGEFSRLTPIRGLEAAAAQPGARIFHGATRGPPGALLADGGRALTVCATAPDLAQAIARAYRAIARIDWPQGFCRRDIGQRALDSGDA